MTESEKFDSSKLQLKQIEIDILKSLPRSFHENNEFVKQLVLINFARQTDLVCPNTYLFEITTDGQAYLEYHCMAHKKTSIEECIRRKFAKSLYKQLRYKRSYFEHHPEWKFAAVDAFINSSGYQSSRLDASGSYTRKEPSEPGMLYSDIKRLLELVDLGVFKYEDIKDKIPKTNLRVMVAMVIKYPGWMKVDEIASTISESNLEVLRFQLKSLEDKHYTMSENKYLTEMNSVPGLLESIKKVLIIHDIHES